MKTDVLTQKIENNLQRSCIFFWLAKRGKDYRGRKRDTLLNYFLRIFGGVDILDWVLNPDISICWNLLRKAQNCYIECSCVGGLTCSSLWNENQDFVQQRAGQHKWVCKRLSFSFSFIISSSLCLTNSFCLFSIASSPRISSDSGWFWSSSGLWGTDTCCYVLFWVLIPFVTSHVESVPGGWFDYYHEMTYLRSCSFCKLPRYWQRVSSAFITNP